MTYNIDPEYYSRLHHIRPRFKKDIESVLSFIAQAVVSIGKREREAFKEEFRNRIRSYPGNLSVTEKTIDNWRTEISSLFGFVIDAEDVSTPNDEKASEVAKRLVETGDLIDFFRNFLQMTESFEGF